MRAVDVRYIGKVRDQVSSVLPELIHFVVPTQAVLTTPDGEPWDITDEENFAITHYWVPCRVEHGDKGMAIRSYGDIVPVGEVGDVWVQVGERDAWIATACRDAEGGYMLINGQETQIIEVTPNRVGLVSSYIIKGRYRPDV